MKGQALARILGATMTGPDVPSETVSAYVKATDDLRIAFDRPFVNEDAERAYMASVRGLLASLQSDAAARLNEAG